MQLRDSATLAIEEEVFSLGYPNGNNVPQPSYGAIKAKYAMDGSLIIRSNAAFSLGSSGGALFDQKLNLIGMTTFKSPGPNGFFYSLPVEWIKDLIASKDLLSLSTDETPFWALPFDKQPHFMQVVIPYQNKDWTTLHAVAQAWTISQPEAADAWYYLGVADYGLNHAPLAKTELNKALNLNPQHLEVFMQQAKIALEEADFTALDKLTQRIAELDAYESEALANKIVALKQAKAVPSNK